MAEPLSTSATVGTVAGWGIVTSALVGFITSVDYTIVFGAFTGSVFFIVTTTNLARKQIVGYFIFTYACGLFGAGSAANWIENKLDYKEKPLDSLAAVIISAG
ncbi:putative holin [Erwinia sp. MMLR14_017]|uniref:putative holin n=1 Tax=Erwinia sp. MMLR14_017 TaxID=3093842 RepID=UPI00298F719C|nr:putative holin [Erwinia sp. MMLR14_017]MDW8845458.1 putative holin [Erwinia sp. MMLR14_017]